MSDEVYKVVCDGGKRNSIAYGSYKVFSSKGRLLAHHFMVFGFGTSNGAEYLALINAVKFCVREGYRNIHLQGDSSLVLNQIQGIWKTNKPTLKKLRGIARTELSRLESYTLEKIHNKEVKKILGH